MSVYPASDVEGAAAVERGEQAGSDFRSAPPGVPLEGKGR